MRSIAVLLTALSATVSAAPCATTLPDSALPGAMVHGQIAPGGRVSVLQRNLRIGPGGEFVFGVGRDAKGSISVFVNDGLGCKGVHKLQVNPREYAIERVSGLPPKTVTPDPATAARISKENALIVAARSVESAGTHWNVTWQLPARGRISGVYGSQRILNGEPRSPHLGLDIAAPTGTAVVAPSAGVVTLAHQDMVLTGKTLIIDHGHGISSLYMHLSALDVAVGDTITPGQRLGAIGATGRASGPHLHYQLHWYQEKLDPSLLYGDSPMAIEPKR